jgi:hypothetical protein
MILFATITRVRKDSSNVYADYPHEKSIFPSRSDGRLPQCAASMTALKDRSAELLLKRLVHHPEMLESRNQLTEDSVRYHHPMHGSREYPRDTYLPKEDSRNPPR